MFNPSHVFRTLYRNHVLSGLQNFAALEQLSGELVCSDIETEVTRLFLEMQSVGRSAKDLRKDVLCQYSQYWGILRATRVCLYCGTPRKSEHVLPCRHTICDVCLSNFGEPAKGLEYHFRLTMCLICQRRISFLGRIMPPTCRARVVSFDGGGCRGIVSLTYFDALEDVVDVNYPIQDHFDFGIGTSSG